MRSGLLHVHPCRKCSIHSIVRLFYLLTYEDDHTSHFGLVSCISIKLVYSSLSKLFWIGREVTYAIHLPLHDGNLREDKTRLREIFALEENVLVHIFKENVPTYMQPCS